MIKSAESGVSDSVFPMPLQTAVVNCGQLLTHGCYVGHQCSSTHVLVCKSVFFSGDSVWSNCCFNQIKFKCSASHQYSSSVFLVGQSDPYGKKNHL